MAKYKSMMKSAGKPGRKVASGPGKVSSKTKRPRTPPKRKAPKAPPSPVTDQPAADVPAVAAVPAQVVTTTTVSDGSGS